MAPTIPHRGGPGAARSIHRPGVGGKTVGGKLSGKTILGGARHRFVLISENPPPRIFPNGLLQEDCEGYHPRRQ